MNGKLPSANTKHVWLLLKRDAKAEGPYITFLLVYIVGYRVVCSCVHG